jgi:hypothetical protein
MEKQDRMALMAWRARVAGPVEVVSGKLASRLVGIVLVAAVVAIAIDDGSRTHGSLEASAARCTCGLEQEFGGSPWHGYGK